MRKIFLPFLLLLMVFSTTRLSAQCTPDPLASQLGIPGFFPNPFVGPLPDGQVGQAYSQVISVIVPADTTIDLTPFGIPLTQTVSVNALTVNTMNGLAPGITFGACDTTTCSWAGGDAGCFTISGTPTTGGDYSPAVNVTINVDIPGLGPTDLPSFDMATWDHKINGGTAIDPEQLAGFALGQNAPNPASGRMMIPFSAEKVESFTFEVRDLAGKIIHEEAVRGVSGENTISFDAGNLAPGMYFYSLSNAEFRLTERMLIAR